MATGKATDPTEVVMAVERAQLAMQLASQVRTKAVEAAQALTFHAAARRQLDLRGALHQLLARAQADLVGARS